MAFKVSIQEVGNGVSLCTVSSGTSLLYSPDFDDISIENYKRETFPTFMLADGVYVNRSLSLVYIQ